MEEKPTALDLSPADTLKKLGTREPRHGLGSDFLLSTKPVGYESTGFSAEVPAPSSSVLSSRVPHCLLRQGPEARPLVAGFFSLTCFYTKQACCHYVGHHRKSERSKSSGVGLRSLRVRNRAKGGEPEREEFVEVGGIVLPRKAAGGFPCHKSHRSR